MTLTIHFVFVKMGYEYGSVFFVRYLWEEGDKPEIGPVSMEENRQKKKSGHNPENT